MSDLSLISYRAVNRSFHSSGELTDRSSIEALCGYFLHDSFLYRFQTEKPLDTTARFTVFGLLPDWASTFEITFYGVDNFNSERFNIFGMFHVDVFSISESDGSLLATFKGIFERQFFSFSFERAEYTRYDLKVPISRSDVGWSS